MAEAFLKTLLVNSLVFAALFGVVLALRAALRKRLSATLSLVLWAVLAVKLALPFGFESVLSPFGWFTSTPASQEAVLTPAVTAQAFPSDYLSGPQPESISLPLPIAATHVPAQPVVSSQPVTAVQSSPAPAAPLRWADWALLIWASGAAGVAVWLLLGQVALNRRLRMAKEPSVTALAVLSSCKAELGIRADVALKVLPGGSPAIAGLLRPTVLLADGLQDDADALRPVLLHELHHLRNGDLFAILAMNLLTVVYWFHPLVWALFALARRDMETRCDQQVLSRLSREGGLGYVSTLLHFSGYGARERLRAALGWSRPGGAAHPCVLGMGSGRAPMERRIRDMFRSRRADAATRTVAALAAMVMLAASLLTACQPTPEKPAIINKNNGKLEAAIKATATPAATPTSDSAQVSTAPTPDPTPFPAPAALKYALEGAKSFRVDVDAAVSVPNTTAFPVVSVQKDTISQEQADRVIQALVGSQPLYKPTTVLCKQQIQIILDYYQRELEASDTKEMRNTFKKTLQEWMAKYEAAPDAVAEEPASTTFAFNENDFDLQIRYGSEEETVDEDGTEGARFIWTEEGRRQAQSDGQKSISGVTAYTPDKRQMELLIRVHNIGMKDDFPDQGVWYNVRSNIGGMITQSNEVLRRNADALTMEQATAQAQAIIKATGLPFSLSSAQTVRHETTPDRDMPATSWYQFTFKPDVGTIPQSDVAPAHLLGMQEYAPPYTGDSIRLELDNQGILSFNWNNPSRFVTVENSNVALLPFEEVKDIFDQQIVLQNQWYPEDKDIVSRRMEIDRVTLSAMPIRKADEPGGYRYVPVWDFCGRLHARYRDDYPQKGGNYILDKNHERVELGESSTRGGANVSFLTINAIDGSIIDRNKGY